MRCYVRLSLDELYPDLATGVAGRVQRAMVVTLYINQAFRRVHYSRQLSQCTHVDYTKYSGSDGSRN